MQKKECMYVGSRLIHKGRFLSFVEKDYEITDNGKTSKYSWETILYNIKSSNKKVNFAVCVIPIIKNTSKVVIISNFRYAVGKKCLEFPSGIIDQSDSTENEEVEDLIIRSCARELKEETGYTGIFRRTMTLPKLNVSDGVNVLSSVYADPWKSVDCSIYCIFDVEPKENDKQELDECEIIEKYEVELDNLLEFITEKISKENYGCATDLYSFAFGYSFKNM